MKKIYIKSYGCQMNVYDSERMYELMKHHGYKISQNYEESDLIILNTCIYLCVTYTEYKSTSCTPFYKFLLWIKKIDYYF